MIYTVDVYNTILDAAREDKRGNGLSVEEFNRACRVVNQKIFDKYYETFEETSGNSDALGRFKKFDQPVSLTLNALGTARYGSLPSNCVQPIGRPRSLYDGIYRPHDIVTTLEASERNSDYLTAPTETYPICQLGDMDSSDIMRIFVYPPTITSVYLDYLRAPEVPYLDYYVNNTTLNFTFMAEGANTVIPAGSTSRSGVSGIAVASLTKNFEWDDAEFPLIMAMLMQFLGISLPDQLLLSAGTAEELKAEE